MTGSRLAAILVALCAVFCGIRLASASDEPLGNDLPPSAWIIELGGYGVLEPTYLGSKYYDIGFKPLLGFRQAGDREWLSFPNDAFDYNLYETADFRAGAAGNLTLQSRLHGEDIDLRLGKADVDLQGGAFAEYYPVTSVRTRAELLQGVTGNTGLAVNLSADYIWRPMPDWTLTFGPRAQLVNDQYASDYFSTQIAFKNNNNYVFYHAEGGILTSGAEFTGQYALTSQITTKFYIDYNQLMGDAADSPRVALRGSSEQVILGIGATYKFAVQP
ncbi:MAG TPA: MipA/OmpV family protein [Rhodomicrobium sp.]|nr:MipA/OmpV family protein [Rhodomicrobium sp.]